jgi:hypothetical protein
MNDDIDKLLRDDARTRLPDNGFSARVLTALPARAPSQRTWLRPALVFGSAALGSVLAVMLAPAGGSLLQGFADLVQFRGFTPAAITAVAIAGALLASALVLAVDSE